MPHHPDHWLLISFVNSNGGRACWVRGFILKGRNAVGVGWRGHNERSTQPHTQLCTNEGTNLWLGPRWAQFFCVLLSASQTTPRKSASQSEILRLKEQSQTVNLEVFDGCLLNLKHHDLKSAAKSTWRCLMSSPRQIYQGRMDDKQGHESPACAVPFSNFPESTRLQTIRQSGGGV